MLRALSNCKCIVHQSCICVPTIQMRPQMQISRVSRRLGFSMTLSIITSPIRVQQTRGLWFAAGRLDRSELRAQPLVMEDDKHGPLVLNLANS